MKRVSSCQNGNMVVVFVREPSEDGRGVEDVRSEMYMRSRISRGRERNWKCECGLCIAMVLWCGERFSRLSVSRGL